MLYCISAYMGTYGNPFLNKNAVFHGEQKIIHYSCENGIKKAVPLDQHLSTINIPVPNGDPWNGFFDPTLTLMMGCSYNL